MEPKFLHDYAIDEDPHTVTIVKWLDADGPHRILIPAWLWKKIADNMKRRAA
jgi:hypothetical protein